MALSLILGTIIIKRYFQYKIGIILLLLGPVIGFFLLSFTSYLPNLIPSENIIYVSSILQSINSALFFTSILLFFNYFSGQKSSIRLVVISGAIVGVIILQVAALQITRPDLVGISILYQETIIVDWSGLVSIILLPTFILTGIWTYFDIKRSRNNVISKQQLHQLELMQNGIFFIFITGIVLNIIVNGFSSQSDPLYLWLIHILLLGIFVPIGIGLISFAYLTTDKVGFLQPVQVDKLLVIHKIGVPLYEHDFTHKIHKTETELVSGAIKAITAIMEEAFGVSSDIKLIQFQDKELLLDFEKDVGFILITEKETKFLRDSLIRFAKSFSSNFESELRGFNGEIKIFEDSDHILKEAFGI